MGRRRLRSDLGHRRNVALLHTESAATEIALPLRLRDGDRDLAFFSTLSTLGTAVDISHAALDDRMWAMLHKLEGLGSEPGVRVGSALL